MNDPVNDNESSRARRATIEVVALRAGVSRQTVSRAINNKGEISPETRDRVLAAAHDLGYRPSSIARGLKTKRTATLGLVVPDIANPFFAEIARAASETAFAAEYTVLLCNTDEHPEREITVLSQLEAHRVDGIVLVSSRLSDQQLQAAISGWTPMVFINRLIPPSRGRGCILVNEAEAMREAIGHLLERGHRRIGFVGCTSRSRSGRERRRGYLEASERSGLAFQPDWCVECAPNVDGGREAARCLLQAQPELTALLCYNDLVAVGTVQACRALGRSIPKDCAVVGWDDIPLARYLSPALTTLDMPKWRSGVRAMSLLQRLIEDTSLSPTPIRLDADLIVRAST